MAVLEELAELGYRLLPTEGKRRIFRGDEVPLSVTLDHARRGGGVAILLKGLAVLDQDGDDLGPLSDLQSPMVAKSSKPEGRHLFFRGTGTNRIKPVIEGTKVQADLLFNGIVRIPPGDDRRWLTPLISIQDLPLFPMELLKATRKEVMKVLPATPSIEGARRWIRKIHAIEGEGGDKATFRVAVKLASVCDFDQALAEILAWNSEGYATPPWDEKSLFWKIKSAFRYKENR